MAKNICVVGGCKGSGATFIATSLAFAMAKLADGVVFVESPLTDLYKEEPLLINQLSLEKLPRCRLKSYEKINWHLHEKWQKGGIVSIDLNRIQGKYIIIDSPVEYRECDLMICVVDSLPSKVVASLNKIDHLKKYFDTRTLWILNRAMDKDVTRIERYLGIKFDFLVPMERQESFYNAERIGKSLQHTKYMSDEIEAALQNIAKYIVSLY